MEAVVVMARIGPPPPDPTNLEAKCPAPFFELFGRGGREGAYGAGTRLAPAVTNENADTGRDKRL